MDLETTSRYAGKPLIAVLEMYVLECIGHLTPERRSLAEKLVEGTWGPGEWQSIVRKQLGLKSEIDELLRARWLQKQEIAQTNSITITAEDFARQTVDATFSHLL